MCLTASSTTSAVSVVMELTNRRPDQNFRSTDKIFNQKSRDKLVSTSVSVLTDKSVKKSKMSSRAAFLQQKISFSTITFAPLFPLKNSLSQNYFHFTLTITMSRSIAGVQLQDVNDDKIIEMPSLTPTVQNGKSFERGNSVVHILLC